MRRRIVALIVAVASAFVLAQEFVQAQSHSLEHLEKKLLRASLGVQYPSSESDSAWTFVSYPGETALTDTARFEEVSGCPVAANGSTTRLDFDTTFERITRIEPWMDDGQVRSAKGFRKIERIMLRSYDARAVYRCDTGKFGQVHLYFVGLNENGISGLLTVSTET